MTQDTHREWLDGVITRWEKPLLRLCFVILGDASLAQDAVQETFFKAWKNRGRFRGDASEKTWLTRIAVNTCRDLNKSAWRRHTDRSVTPDLLPESPAPCEEGDDTVTRAVMALPPRLKEVTLMHWYQGMTLPEMTWALRVPRSTVNYRLKKAKASLKEALEDWYYEDE